MFLIMMLQARYERMTGFAYFKNNQTSIYYGEYFGTTICQHYTRKSYCCMECDCKRLFAHTQISDSGMTKSFTTTLKGHILLSLCNSVQKKQHSSCSSFIIFTIDLAPCDFLRFPKLKIKSAKIGKVSQVYQQIFSDRENSNGTTGGTEYTRQKIISRYIPLTIILGYVFVFPGIIFKVIVKNKIQLWLESIKCYVLVTFGNHLIIFTTNQCSLDMRTTSTFCLQCKDTFIIIKILKQ